MTVSGGPRAVGDLHEAHRRIRGLGRAASCTCATPTSSTTGAAWSAGSAVVSTSRSTSSPGRRGRSVPGAAACTGSDRMRERSTPCGRTCRRRGAHALRSRRSPVAPRMRRSRRRRLPSARAPHRDRRARRSPARAATASFVLCIENNAIRDQALLLCESIRQFGGSYRDAPILAFSPRAGLAVDGETRRVLAEMGVEYVDEPLNTTCREYGPANRVFAGKWAEQHADTDFVVVLDSDTVYLKEPEMPSGDVAVRPVDSKGSATRGPGDAFEDYWVALAAMCGTTIDRLPYLRATIDGQRIRASYNAGLIVCSPRQGHLHARAPSSSPSRSRPACGPTAAAASTSTRRPAPSAGRQRVLGLEPGGAGDRDLGDDRSRRCIIRRATTCRCISSRRRARSTPIWSAVPPVHVHYHYMFTPHRYEVAMEIMAKLGVTVGPARVARRARSASPTRRRRGRSPRSVSARWPSSRNRVRQSSIRCRDQRPRRAADVSRSLEMSMHRVICVAIRCSARERVELGADQDQRRTRSCRRRGHRERPGCPTRRWAPFCCSPAG